ncbi:hypothetical protein LTR91_012448 [Friedmanniomyces endolithicus]|uniref:Uncharacterized protein n=1 Tax=Friedmanniomyces endolithicus TaxID=329885 RepID=A0AAN6KFN5_9PEZI|nr:hypothetical protein LTR35_004744 [Friedmanniomyces endolithicus]KAK0299209.1 hypothetical protein LTS00_002320 [Friedmanniomyces endolithicus]KAK0921931.1 hypothetical protein LTR57_008295 [Friedmanniomyces endolithicus]KAK0965210.1 hypothetical protein LTS01_018468 [Friedmanniomyces endolithicus]KAK0979802.1 hypothetical protein LTR91_012448 [Friedmanniomyces endolithicus]
MEDNPSKDPRKRGYQRGPSKRPASRSPERSDDSTARKVMKRKPSDGLSTPNNNMPLSRAASSFNKTGNRPTQPSLATEARRTSTAREHGGGSVNSPDSPGSKRSQYEDATSGRSTPLSVIGTVSRQSIPPPPLTLTSVEPRNAIEDTFMDFSSCCTKIAQLSQSQSQWEARLRRANLEHESMAKNYAAFPQLREQKTAAQKYAREQCEMMTKDLNEERQAQRGFVKDIAVLIESEAAEVKTTTTTTNTSAALAEEMRELRAEIAKMRSDADASASAKEQLMEARLTRLTATTDVKIAAKVGAELQPLRAEIAKLEAGTALASASASAQEMQHLRSRVDTLEPDVNTAKKKINQTLTANGQIFRNQSEISKLQARDADRKRESDALRQDFKDYGTRNVDLLDAIRKKQQTSTQELQLLYVRLREDVHEEGKPSIVTRMKNYDKVLNNLTTSVKLLENPRAPLHERVNAVEELVGTLSNDLKEKATSSPSQPLPVPTRGLSAADPGSDLGGLSSADLQGFEERLQRVERLPEELDAKLEVKLKEADEGQAERDEAVATHVKVELDTFKDEMNATLDTATMEVKSDVAKWRTEDAEELKKNLADVKTEMDGLKGDAAKVWQDLRGTEQDLKRRVGRIEESVKQNAIKRRTEDAEALNKHLSDTRNITDGQGTQTTALRTDVRKCLEHLELRVDGVEATVRLKSDQAFVVAELDLLKKALDELRVAATSRRSTPGPPAGRCSASSLSYDTTSFPPAPTTNGFHPQINGSSPKTNGLAAPAIAPPLTEAVWEKLDALTNITNSLRFRFDNLTSEEMVAKMLDQFATVWPHAKDCEAALTSLHTRLVKCEGSVSEMRVLVQHAVERGEQTKDLPDKFEMALQKFEKLADDFRIVADGVAENRGTLSSLREVVDGTLLA